MSLIRSIAIGLSADTRGFALEMLRASSYLDTVAQSSRQAQDAISGLDLSKVHAAGPGAAAASPAAQGDLGNTKAETGQITADLRSGLAGGLAPLKELGPVVAQQLDKIGGTVVTLARRIDAAMKFQALDASLEKVQAKLSSSFARGSVQSVRSVLAIRSVLTSLGDVAGSSLSKLFKIDLSRVQSGARGLTSAFKTIPAPVKATTNAVKSLGLQIGIAFGIVGLAYKAAQALKTFFAGGIKGASDLNETVSKTQFVFGDAATTIFTYADDVAKKYGILKQTVIDGAVSLGRYGKSAGQTQAESAKLGVTLTQLALDLSSLENIDVATAIDRISSAMSGQGEPLRRNGAFITEQRVKLEAYRLGLTKTKGELTEQVKIMARASLVQHDLADASGDLARTAGGAANQFRRAGGGIQNFSVTVGQVLLPATQAAIGGFNRLLASVIETFERNRKAIETFATYVTSGFENIFEAVYKVPQVLGVFSADFATAFGSKSRSVLDAFTGFMSRAIAQVGVVFRNLPQYAAIARLKLKEQIDSIPEYFRFVREAAAVTGAFLADRFRFASQSIAAEIAFIGDHFRYFKDLGVAVVTSVSSYWIETFQALPTITSAFVTAIGQSIAGLFPLATLTLEAIYSGFSLMWEGIKTLTTENVSALGTVFGALAGDVAKTFAPVLEVLQGAFILIGEYFGNVKKGILEGLAQMTKNVKAVGEKAKVEAPHSFTLPKPPEITSYQSQVDELLKKIRDAEEERKKIAADVPPPAAAAKPAAEAAKPEEGGIL